MQGQKWVVDGVEFGVGDKVRVMRQVETDDPNGMGNGVKWVNSWATPIDYISLSGETVTNRGMDAYLGLEFVIAEINEHGAYFEIPCDLKGTEFEAGGYGFPLKALDMIAKYGSHEPVKEELELDEKPIAERLAYYETHLAAIQEKIKALQNELKELNAA